jgi:hypothetical protein
MTTVQEADINNALLVLMYEWKMGIIDQQQALKEFKQCLKYYSIVENIMEFQKDERKDLRIFEYYGDEKTIERTKLDMAEQMTLEIVKAGCVSFEEVPVYDQVYERYRQFRMKIMVVIPKNKKAS